ncbi:hypothetical protein [Sphaerisporangium aureirubrum]|uniref:DUF3137 domain-containing protein n=1 Tax=Sphaerisporangium aureirubrum TaxID=1544736 RepID=A0ABW1NBJ5_9ACTN
MNPQAPRRPDVVRRYFVAPPDPGERSEGIAMLVMGVAAVVIFWIIALNVAARPSVGAEFIVAIGFMIVGSYLGWRFGAGGVKRLRQYSRQAAARAFAPDDNDMEAWLFSDVEAVKEHAVKEMNIPDESMVIKPVVMIGPAFPTDYAIDRAGQPRFASYEAAVVCLTDSYLCVYSCLINFVEGKLELETTHEFMLSDVTTIATVNDRLASRGGSASRGEAIRMEGPIRIGYITPADVSVTQDFRITLTSGEAFSINVASHANGISITRETAYKRASGIAKALRSSLREIKSV